QGDLGKPALAAPQGADRSSDVHRRPARLLIGSANFLLIFPVTLFGSGGCGTPRPSRRMKANAPPAMTVWRTTKAKVGTWFGFVLMCLGMFMAILDIQVVATSLPSIQEALAISPDAMSWIQTAYLIAEVIAIPLTGWLTRVLTLR